MTSHAIVVSAQTLPRYPQFPVTRLGRLAIVVVLADARGLESDTIATRRLRRTKKRSGDGLGAKDKRLLSKSDICDEFIRPAMERAGLCRRQLSRRVLRIVPAVGGTEATSSARFHSVSGHLVVSAPEAVVRQAAVFIAHLKKICISPHE